jgi:DNA-binding NarL/FixJ family response regulator
LPEIELEEDLVRAVYDLAVRDSRPVNELANELLYIALKRREQAEVSLGRWRTLTRREQQVVALVCKNYTSHKIAEELFVTVDTVNKHVRNALGKFEVRNRMQLRQALADWDFSAWIDGHITSDER